MERDRAACPELSLRRPMFHPLLGPHPAGARVTQRSRGGPVQETSLFVAAIFLCCFCLVAVQLPASTGRNWDCWVRGDAWGRTPQRSLGAGAECQAAWQGPDRAFPCCSSSVPAGAQGAGCDRGAGGSKGFYWAVQKQQKLFRARVGMIPAGCFPAEGRRLVSLVRACAGAPGPAGFSLEPELQVVRVPHPGKL